MSLEDKIKKIVYKLGAQETINEFATKVTEQILKDTGTRMLQEQKMQNERFLKSLNEWDKMMNDTIKEKVDKYILSRVKG